MLSLDTRLGLKARLIAASLLVGLLGAETSAHAAALEMACKTSADDAGETIACQVHAPDGSSPKDIVIKDSDDNTLNFTATKFDWTRDSAAYYFVVQTAEYTTSELRRIGSFIERAAFPVGKRMTGVATFDSAFKERAALGAFGRQIQDAASTIASAPAGTRATEVADVLDKPLETLADSDASRKALVLVTDGSTGISDARKNEIARNAREKGIVILNIVVNGSARTRSPVLGEMAEKTGGSHHDLASSSLDKILSFASDLPKYLENGAILSIDAAGLPQTLDLQAEATLANGSQATSETVSIERLTEDGAIEGLFRTLADNLLAVLAGLAMLAGLFLVLRSMLGGRLGSMSRQAPAIGSEDDAISGPPGVDEGRTEIIFRPTSGVSGTPPVGYFEIVGTGTEPLPIKRGQVRIGRHAENDICLKNNSVHRKHAVCQIADNGTVTIEDLNTQNGVIVNGVRVDRHDLADGDLIELGEVRLRFIANREAV